MLIVTRAVTNLFKRGEQSKNGCSTSGESEGLRSGYCSQYLQVIKNHKAFCNDELDKT